MKDRFTCEDDEGKEHGHELVETMDNVADAGEEKLALPEAVSKSKEILQRKMVSLKITMDH